MNLDTLCLNCMDNDSGEPTCANCGSPLELSRASARPLPPRTLLRGQYLIGRVLGEGSFGITYLAFDTAMETKVAIQEYMPKGIANRTPGQTTIQAASPAGQEQFEYNCRLSSHPKPFARCARGRLLSAPPVTLFFLRISSAASDILKVVEPSILPTVVLDGVLSQFIFRNAHSFIQMDTKDASGHTARWYVEWSGASVQARSGINRNTLRPGDHVTIVGNPSRHLEDHRARLISIKRLPDGWKWSGVQD